MYISILTNFEIVILLFKNVLELKYTYINNEIYIYSYLNLHKLILYNM